MMLIGVVVVTVDYLREPTAQCPISGTRIVSRVLPGAIRFFAGADGRISHPMFIIQPSYRHLISFRRWTESGPWLHPSALQLNY
mmetsp:Transcript_3036/g.5834  ORF Transcript_3036/g.5834 Transcript_3036/m.5834 type:complete len:84 (+) Transcript_3036:35-286(+)